jgi:hypothetical protein
VQLAQRVGRVVRQVAECTLIDDEVVARVEPLLVEPGTALAQTREEQNRVEVHTGWSAPLCASGPGAGGTPTATALLSDLLSPRLGAPLRGRVRRSVLDVRRSRWAVSIHGASTLLHRRVAGCGLVHTDADATQAWTIVDDATTATIDATLDALATDGAAPIAARLDESLRSGGCRP